MQAAPSQPTTATPAQIKCTICNEWILKPVKLGCGHQFCSFCIRSNKYKHPKKIIVCSLCQKQSSSAELDKEGEKSIIGQFMNQAKTRIFWAHGTTINDYDSNETHSQGFFYIMRGDQFFGDIVWGGGTEHDSYIGQVGRGKGKVNFLQGSAFQFGVGYKSIYSNTPHEDWYGRFQHDGSNTYTLMYGRYDWHGWGRNSSGTLQMKLKEILTFEQLSNF